MTGVELFVLYINVSIVALIYVAEQIVVLYIFNKAVILQVNDLQTISFFYIPSLLYFNDYVCHSADLLN